MNNLIRANKLIMKTKREIQQSISAIKNNKKTIKKAFGFTLIEVMIAVAIVGILATIAYPSYVDYVTRTNRAEALRELVRIANLQEQFFVDTNSYTATLSQLGLGLNASFETETGNYIITSVINGAGNTFTLTATAQGIQAVNDNNCITMGITDTGQRLPLGLPGTICWGQ